MISLNAEQAEYVRGLSTDGHALEPRPLTDGTFILPEDVLTDPAHSQYVAYLTPLPIVATPEEIAWETDPTLLDAARWNKNRLVGADGVSLLGSDGKFLKGAV